MTEPCQGGSIFRNLFLPPETELKLPEVGTFPLRYALAEHGSSESQVLVAKRLLRNLSHSSGERSFSAQLAVFWLLQAADKGYDEAFILLRDCANSRIGISPLNKLQVEKCLRLSDEEKKARKIAFAIINGIMSDTEEVMSEDIFQENIDLIFAENQQKGEGIWNVPRQKKQESIQPEKKEELTTFRKDDSILLKQKLDESLPKDEKISPKKPLVFPKEDANKMQVLVEPKEDDATSRVSFSKVVSSVQSCLEGNVPLVSLIQGTNLAEKRSWVIKYLFVVWNLILKGAEKFIQGISQSVLLLALLFMCMLLQFVDVLSTPGNETSHFIKKLNIFAITLLCLFSMISSTGFVLLQIDGDNFRKWLRLIKMFDPEVRSAEAERKYIARTTIPFVTFFIVSFFYMAVIPLNDGKVTFPDIGLLSFLLMFFTDKTISQQRYYVNISLVLNALTCLYTLNLQNVISDSFSYFNYTISYEIASNLYLRISALSCLTLPFILPFLYIKMARGIQRGWHLVLLPHLMSLVWMNLTCIHLSDATSTSQLYSGITWLVIFITLKCTGLPFALVLYLLFKGADHFRMEVLILCIVFILIYFASQFLVKKFKISHDSKLWSSLLCISILVLSYQVTKPGGVYLEDSEEILPWHKYQTFCYNNNAFAWYRKNTLEMQLSCMPLKGSKVAIQGAITDIEVVQVHNKMELVANVLPRSLQSLFVCGFGRSFQSCENEGMTALQKEHCSLYESLNSLQCHLQNWDEYEYRIVLELATRDSPEVSLRVYGDSELVKNLQEGDILQVVGVLESNIGKSKPGFNLKYAKCVNCNEKFTYNATPILPTLDYRPSLKNLVQLYFAPILQYIPK